MKQPQILLLIAFAVTLLGCGDKSEEPSKYAGQFAIVDSSFRVDNSLSVTGVELGVYTGNEGELVFPLYDYGIDHVILMTINADGEMTGSDPWRLWKGKFVDLDHFWIYWTATDTLNYYQYLSRTGTRIK